MGNLVSATGSGTQLIGGAVVFLLYIIVGLLAGVGSVLVVPRMLLGGGNRYSEVFLVIVAAFYLSFAAYFGATDHAWNTELIGVAVFLVCATGGAFSRPAIALGYILHSIWDLSHSLSGTSFGGLSLTDIPLGYGIFCATYDFTVSYYFIKCGDSWREPGRFVHFFWRESTSQRHPKVAIQGAAIYVAVCRG